MNKRLLVGQITFFSLIFCGAITAETRPNVFIAISDDQSWPHASAYGSQMVQTPNFDRIAREGVLFNNAFCPSPGCSPSRAAFLTGRNTWQIEHAGTHASYFDPKYITFPDSLAHAGYFVGHTGKGWGPGDFGKLGRPHNPAGPRFGAKDKKKPGYAAAFENFLQQRPADKPFCFWFGSHDPHRSFKKNAGVDSGKKLSDAEVPPFLPDTPEVRTDLLDYTFEVERFDRDLGEMLALMEQAGELDNTLIIVTSDNGMAFPRAKANCYEYGIHMPLAIRWGQHIAAQRTVDDLVGFTDLTATIYEATGVSAPKEFPLVGRSIMNLLCSLESGRIDPSRDAVFAARERHSSSRYNSLGYPQRCMRTEDYLFIRNLKPERAPAGAAQKYDRVTYARDGAAALRKLGKPFGGFHDIDACPTLSFLIEQQSRPTIMQFFDLAVGNRPAEELYDIRADPGCLQNRAADVSMAELKNELSNRLTEYLRKTRDARVVGDGDVWETYPRVSSLRWYPVPEWANQQPTDVPKQEWLELRRPKAE